MMNAKKINAMKAFTVFLAVGGVLLWMLGILTRVLGGDVFGRLFPKPENVHFGFVLVGTLYLLMAASMRALIKSKKKIIEETDERNQMITEQSACIAFTAQTLLLTLSVFLLLFMGYLSRVAMFAFLFGLLISCIVFLGCLVYFKLKI